MGALERDNQCVEDPLSLTKTFEHPDASPLAVTDRQTPNTMLGGDEAFTELMKKA